MSTCLVLPLMDIFAITIPERTVVALAMDVNTHAGVIDILILLGNHPLMIFLAILLPADLKLQAILGLWPLTLVEFESQIVTKAFPGSVGGGLMGACAASMVRVLTIFPAMAMVLVASALVMEDMPLFFVLWSNSAIVSGCSSVLNCFIFGQ